jgi:hypothetical protein
MRTAHGQSPILGGHFERRLQLLRETMRDNAVDPDEMSKNMNASAFSCGVRPIAGQHHVGNPVDTGSPETCMSENTTFCRIAYRSRLRGVS